MVRRGKVSIGAKVCSTRADDPRPDEGEEMMEGPDLMSMNE